MSNFKITDYEGNCGRHYFTPQEACWIHGVPATPLNQARACALLGSEAYEGGRVIPAAAVRAFARYLENRAILHRLRVLLQKGADELDELNGKSAGENSTTNNNESI